MINNQGRNHPGGHGHPLLSSTTSDNIIRKLVFVKVNVQIVANADSILKTCSRLLCKNCKCFTKDKEGEDEDIFLSQRYQGFLDGPEF